MNIHLGIDVGAIGIKAAMLVNSEEAQALAERCGWQRLASPAEQETAALVAEYRRTRGRPMQAFRDLMDALLPHLQPEQIASLVVTGSGGQLIAGALGVQRCNEFQAICRAVDRLHPQVRTVFEIGGETSKYLRLDPDPHSGKLGILDYSTNGDCAAGTGAFLDQQASRLQYAVEEIGDIVASAERAAQIAGRCSVFAKSDMIHAQQKGFVPPEVLRGLCNAVAANYKTAVVKGRAPEGPIALLGGVSANSAVVKGLCETFELNDGELFIPPAAASLTAVGAAILASESADRQIGAVEWLKRLQEHTAAGSDKLSRSRPLNLDKVKLLRDRVREYQLPDNGHVIDTYLGIDIGSVGTKLALIDDEGEVVHTIFTRTEGRPIQVVGRILRELEEAVGTHIRIRGVGTTGSGRELIGELVGADSINDEITAHKTGATFIGDQLLGRRPDTIFEIGGQDSKYISLQAEDSGDTIVVDFTMNEACAAGTGSFLEERAEELGVSIKGEFAELALSSKAPIRLGERCTVFMERDVNTAMQRGAERADVIAGLAFSIAYNYINRVVRGRAIGDCIFFQGGTAYNDAVAAAFAAITGKEIIVPPHNAVLGCIGAALLAREKMTATGQESRFRGFDITQVDYSIREFGCKGCGNHCSVQEFSVEGEKTFWGDKCSDRFRKQSKTERKPIIPDLVSLRNELLYADDGIAPAVPANGKRVGIPLAMYTHDLLPLWRRFFRDCGFEVVLSRETNKKSVHMGLDAVVAEPCFPIIVAHGHAADLVDQKVDYIWLPNVLNAETKFLDNEAFVCPWGQTLPFVLRQASAFRDWQGRILCPTVRLRSGMDEVRKALVAEVAQLGVDKKTANIAFETAVAAYRRYRIMYQKAGREALTTLTESGEPGMVIVGRPYNIHDPGVSLSTARKLRELYGVNVLPIDALPVEEIDVRDINENMFWEYGRKILAAARLVSEHPNLHIIYITNFKCGPDSYVKGYIRSASGKPFLTLQFDGHSNDAGMMTRCEAYLDSKGILRWWRTCKNETGQTHSKDGHSTSRRWPTREPDLLQPHSDPSVSTLP